MPPNPVDIFLSVLLAVILFVWIMLDPHGPKDPPSGTAPI